jgi:hypothetical protein
MNLATEQVDGGEGDLQMYRILVKPARIFNSRIRIYVVFLCFSVYLENVDELNVTKNVHFLVFLRIFLSYRPWEAHKSKETQTRKSVFGT